MTSGALARLRRMERLSLLGRALPGSCRLRVTVLRPGTVRPYDEREWDDSLVVVEEGEIELDRTDGSSTRFGAGAVLFLAGLPLAALSNRGEEAVVLAAVSRAHARRVRLT